LVTGFSRDKNVDDMVDRLAQSGDMVFATRSRHPRSMPPGDIAAVFRSRGVEAVPLADTADALDAARQAARPGDLVLGTGSLFVVAEVRESVLGIKPELYPDLLPPDLR
jgi:folylpolyglutamate synthase/dihydropteroate synthase